MNCSFMLLFLLFVFIFDLVEIGWKALPSIKRDVSLFSVTFAFFTFVLLPLIKWSVVSGTVEIWKFENSVCQVSSFMYQVQLSCVKFMFHLDLTWTKFLDLKQTYIWQTDPFPLTGMSQQVLWTCGSIKICEQRVCIYLPFKIK